MNNWWLYVDKSTLQVVMVSPSPNEETDCHKIAIERELGIHFVENPHDLNKYVVYFDGNECVFHKKSSGAFNPFFYTPIMIDRKVEDAAITVKVNKNKLRFSINVRVLQIAFGLYGNAAPSQNMVEVYISKKNDPNHLLQVLSVNMKKVMKDGFEEFDFNHDIDRVSIFTRKVFESYGLEKYA